MRTSVGSSHGRGAFAAGTLFFAALFPAVLASATFAGCLADTGGASGDGGPDAIAFDGSGVSSEDGGKMVDSAVADSGTLDSTLPPTDSGTIDASAPDANDGATAPIDASDGAVDAGGDANDGAMPLPDAGMALLRFANMVPDLPSAIDVCAAPEGSSLVGPIAKLSGIPAGVGYGQLTWYVPTPPTTSVHVRIVAANAPDCSTALVPDFDNLSIAVAQHATVVLLGSTSDAGANPPHIAVYPDDPQSGFPTNDGSRIRIIHAAPLSPPADFQIGSGPTYATPEFTAVPFGGATSTTTTAAGGYTPDSNGYFVEPNYSEQYTAVVGGTQVASFANEYSGITAFFVGLPGSSTAPLKFVACDDADTPPVATKFFTTCVVQPGPPTMSNLRILNLAPTLPAVNLCFALEDGPGTVYGPIGASVGFAGGAAYGQLTPQFAGAVATIPTDTSFTITAVAAGSPCSSSPVFTLTNQYVYGMYRGGPSLVNTTLPIFQGGLSPSEIYIPQWAYATSSGDPTQAQLSIEVADLDQEAAFDSPLYDFYATAADGGVQPLALGAAETNIEYAYLAPGTYSLGVTSVDGGAVYATSGATFGAGESWGLWLYDANDGGKGVSRCNLGTPDAGTVTTCLQ